MRRRIGVVVLVTCAVLAAARAEDWRSDPALFQAAVEWTPRYPEALIQRGAVALRRGQWWDAYAWTIRAAIFSESRPEPPHFPGMPDWYTRVQGQLVWIDAFRPVCGLPAARPWCA